MAYEQKPNTGVLFKNGKKTTEKQPDYQGSCLVNGVAMKISSWINTSKKDGSKYMALIFQLPQPAHQPLPTAATKPASEPLPGEQPGDDDVPF